MATDGYRLGIDLGTSTTVAVLAGPAGRTRPLLFDSSPLLSSAVFAGPDPGLLTGLDAERAALGHPAGLEPNPKLRVDDGSVWLGDREHPVVDLLAAVLARVAGEARRVTGRAPDGVVLTHPAGWGRTRIGVLTEAATEAGLGRVGFVAEPVAAAAYFTDVLGRRLPPGRHLVVYDLGAGTFDLGVVRPLGDGYEVVATDGLGDVGGLDLDAAVVGHLRRLTADATEAWGRLDWPRTPADQRARRTLWADARAAKEMLSRHVSSTVDVPLVDRQLHLTRDEFEELARPYLERTVTLAVATLRRIGVPREEIGGVFLVGGASRVPLAASLLHRVLRIAPATIDQPELVVAEGSLLARPAPDQRRAVGGAPAAATPPAVAAPPPASTPTAPTPTAPAPSAPTPTAPAPPTPTAPPPLIAPRPRVRASRSPAGRRRVPYRLILSAVALAIIAVMALVQSVT